ncbi:MAG: polysaccharide biosynthesis/export family protein [Acidobacteriota bacterium]|nr:polysaccharide biosynthesis/export family protein [Acidobacteriota bacterium]
MKTVKKLSVFGFLFLFIFPAAFNCFGQEAKPVEKGETDKTQAEKLISNSNIKKSDERYRIGLQDVLEITVYKHPELSQPNIRMDETGRIRLPRIDASILAICKTENELSEEIVNLYKQNYLRDPYVTVFVKEQNSQPLSVIGAVQKPGNFFTNRRLTLLELLSFAGGQDVDRAGSKIQVARVGGVSGCKLESNSETAANTESEGVTFFSYNLEDVLKGKTNPVMRPGDIVVVMEAEHAYVTGNVIKPQPIPLTQIKTLSEAIAAAGGILPSTKKDEVRIVRQGTSGDSKQELVFNLKDIKDKKIPDPLLQANDIVEVPTDKVKDFTNNLVKAVTGGVGAVFYRIP